MIRYAILAISFWIGTVWSITPEKIDNYATETLHNWQIPGLALAVIENGEAYVQGYGVRERGTDKLVDIQTLFQINSLTKAFTALTVNMLAKKGDIDWDLPIKFYLPHFHSKDPEITEQLSLRDLLSHRSGFPGNLYEGWRLFRNTKRNLDDLIQRLTFIEPIFPFRSNFNYDNVGYAISGEIVANVSGLSWSNFCHQKIFTPLNMNRTFISYSTFLKDENSALPHNYQTTDSIVGYDWEKDSLEAASGINSCAQDMAQWLHYCLKDYPNFSEILNPQIVINPEDLLPKVEIPTFTIISHGQSQLYYAMGWWLYDLEDVTVYRHTGSSSGMQSVLAIIPEKQIGVVILSNQSKHPAVSALMNRILDDLLERPEANWEAQGLETFAETEQNKKEWLASCLLARKEDIPPSLSLDKYTGIYTHPGYGSISIKENNAELNVELLFCGEVGNLVHWEGDQFEIKNTPSGSLKPFLCEFLVLQDEKMIVGLKINDMGVFHRSEL